MKLVPYFRRSESPARIWPDTASLFEDLFDGFSLTTKLLRNSDRWMPNVDIFEKEGSLILRAEVPGLSEKEIELSLEGNLLTLRGEKKHDKDEDRNSYHRKETFYGSFSRSFALPETANLDKVKAEYRNGVLTITIPQKPEARPREIPVTVS